MVTLVEAQDVIARQKRLVTDMAWTSKRGKVEFEWVEATMALMFVDQYEAAEQLAVKCQWRKKGRKIPEHWTFSLFFREQRIYAIDIQPTSIHENKVGKGRAYYKKEIDGIHQHFWTDEGYGYAEPIEAPTGHPEVVWKMFLKRAGIEPGDFFHPDMNQPELDL